VLGTVRSAPVNIRDDEVGVQFKFASFSISENQRARDDHRRPDRAGGILVYRRLRNEQRHRDRRGGLRQPERHVDFQQRGHEPHLHDSLTNDTRVEGNETILLALSNPPGWRSSPP
jgi:hypothetical protein